MGACETTPPTMRAGETSQRPPVHVNPGTALPRSLSSAAAGRGQARSSSPAPAGAALRALQLDPGPRDGTKPQRRGKATSQSPPRPGDRRQGHRVNSPCPLDSRGPHGCGNVWQVLGSNQRRLSRRFYRGLPDKIAYSLWPAETRILTTLSDKLNHSSTESRSGSPDMSGRRRLSRTRSFDCLKPSSSRGESHPPALTEPCLTVSRYTALLI